jgi:hypothetical protein
MPTFLIKCVCALLTGAVLMSACRVEPSPMPTVALAASTVTPGPALEPPMNLPPTWTPLSATAVAPTPVPAVPSRAATSVPTAWPTATATWTPSPTMTATAMETAVAPATDPPPIQATSPAPPATGANLLPNPSFEEGWYHLNGLPELQVPDQWLLEWDAGHNPLDPDPWNAFVRPETRVLSRDFLPVAEHSVFIWDGRQTVKIFKGQGAVSFRLLTDVYLAPGSYQLVIHVFPDLVDGYTADHRKIWAPDPLSGEVRLVVNSGGTDWMLPAFGRKNTFYHNFEITTAQQVRVGMAARGRWAILNNGWFMDDWALRRVR